MRWGIKGIVYSLFVFGIAAQAAPVTSSFGRFSGILRHDSIKKDQFAKIDFIPSREEGNTLYLKAILTLHFGDFASGEYVGIHFDDVRFDSNISTRSLVFEQPDQPVTLVVRKFTGTEFVGDFRSNYGGASGQIILSSKEMPALKYPVIEPVWGEYRGVCNSRFTKKPVETILQMFTYRSIGVSKQGGNPFRAYTVTGTIGENSDESCARYQGKECVWGQITQGSFNFFKNGLTVFTSHGNMVCSQGNGGIDCNGCSTLKRTSAEMTRPRALQPVQFPPGWVESNEPATGDVTTLQGEYTGFLHHEYLDVYQNAAFNLLTYQAPAKPGERSSLRMSAIATLYFGDLNGAESLSYHYEERGYPNPLTTPQIVFSQADADVDSILQVTKFVAGEVSGVWFSRHFGRVGTFHFRKDGKVALPANAKVMQELSGDFSGDKWDLYTTIGLAHAEPGNQNPFSPLEFGGWAIMKNGLTPKYDSLGGSYDFYTGRMFMDFEDGNAFVGQRDSREKLSLRKAYSKVTSPMQEFDPVRFRLVK